MVFGQDRGRIGGSPSFLHRRLLQRDRWVAATRFIYISGCTLYILLTRPYVVGRFFKRLPPSPGQRICFETTTILVCTEAQKRRDHFDFGNLILPRYADGSCFAAQRYADGWKFCATIFLYVLTVTADQHSCRSRQSLFNRRRWKICSTDDGGNRRRRMILKI